MWFLSLPKECIFLFPKAAILRESGLLQCIDVDDESLESTVDDGCFSEVINLVDYQRGQDTLSWHSSLLVTRIVSCFSVVTLVQELQSACQFSHSSKHLMEQADCGRSAPYWLGLSSLRQVVADQWDCQDPSHFQRQPIAPKPMPISLDL